MKRGVQTSGDPSPFPASVRPMLATLVGTRFSDARWLFEPKLDGFRILALICKGGITLCTPDDSGVGPDFPLPRKAL